MAVIDLSQLPAPDVVETRDFETILAERKATLISLYPEDEQEAVARTLTLESEPLVKYLEENAYREVILRQRINEAAKAGMVAYAIKNDLDQLAANNNVERLVITHGDDTQIPPVDAVLESDSDLRQRIPAAFEGMSVAGPTGAYEFHALSADGRVADASANSPAPAEVTIAVLSRKGDGTASDDLLMAVSTALNDESVRPVADRLTVVSAEIVNYAIDAVLYVYPGPATEPIGTYGGYQAYQPVTAPAGRSYIDQSKNEYHIDVQGGGSGTQLDRQLQDALEKFEREKRARQRASMNHDG